MDIVIILEPDPTIIERLDAETNELFWEGGAKYFTPRRRTMILDGT